MPLIASWLMLSMLPTAAPAPTETKNWLEFRGPDGIGHYQGPELPSEWGPDKNVDWKTNIPGTGWSSPILVGETLFLTTAVPLGEPTKPNYELRALAIDSKTGKIVWNELLFTEDAKKDPQPHKKNSHASPTAVSDGKIVIFHFGHMGIAALDLQGKTLWKTQKYKYIPQHGNGGSPILVDDAVIISCDGNDAQFVAALDKTTGKELWKTDRKSSARMKFSFATAQLGEINGQRVIISPASDFVAAYDPKTGKEVWRVNYPKAGWSVVPRPVIGHGMIYVCTGFVNQHLIAIKPSGTGDITKDIAWSVKRYAPNTPTPILVGDELYTISDQGTMSCINAKTGEVYWAERLKGGGYSASPIYADGKLYVSSESGVGLVIAASKKELNVLAENDMKEKTFATITPNAGSIYLRTESQLFKFTTKK